MRNDFGTVRVSPYTRRDSVTTTGRQITCRTNEALIARVREQRAHDLAHGAPSVGRVLCRTIDEWLAAGGGSRSW